MIKWKDDTTYRRGEKNRVPRVLRLTLPYNVQLLVHRPIHGDGWFYSLRWNGQYVADNLELVSEELEDAKKEALKDASSFLASRSRELSLAAAGATKALVE